MVGFSNSVLFYVYMPVDLCYLNNPKELIFVRFQQYAFSLNNQIEWRNYKIPPLNI